MSQRTTFLSRLLGLYCILAALSLITHKEATLATVNALIYSPPLLLLLGVITLVAGLALVLGHNIWSGGLLPVVVSLVGWITLLKGLLFLFLSPGAFAGLLAALHYGQYFYWYGGTSLLIGLYLTYGGFRASRR
jgi:vacuolar-type H+-ATPase subunit I/STV1